MGEYKSVVIADSQGRITIPSKVREDMGQGIGKLVFNLEYDQVTNELKLIPIGLSTTK